jgi:hypothetical protein
MKKVTETYYKLPIGSIPFKEIPSLEEFSAEYVYCSSFPLIEFMTLDFHLVSVYNVFDNDIREIKELQSEELLFGKVVADKPSTRGKAKCIKIGSEEKNIDKVDLPHLRYNSSDRNLLSGNWFYMKDGKYVILSGIKSELEKVRHLEGISIYGDNIIRLRLVIELLKKNVKRGLINLSEEDYKGLAYKVLRTDPTLLRTDDSLIEDGVNNWLSPMLLTPLYEDILPQDRGKVKE